MNTPPYDFYTGTYGGVSVRTEDWPRISAIATAYLQRTEAICRVTPYFGSLADAEPMVICSIADALQTYESARAGGRGEGVRSESIGSVSVSYATISEAMPDGLRAALSDAVAPWLHVCQVVV